MKISKWMTEDPVLLHRNIVAHKIKIDKEHFKVLMSKLLANHKEYYRDVMGLRLIIDFPKYGKVMANVPYSAEPVNFYKWWRSNDEVVTLSKSEMLTLFMNVDKISPKTLLKKHRKMIGR